MGWGIEFNAAMSRVHKSNIDELIETNEQMLEKNKTEFIVLAASTPADNFDHNGVFEHRTDFIKERVSELWHSTIELAKELALLYAAKESGNITEY